MPQDAPDQPPLPITEHRFRLLTDALQVGVVLHDARTQQILYVNPMACELLGLTEDQLLGRSSFDPEWHFVDAEGRRLAHDDFPAVRVAHSGEPLQNFIVGVFRPRTRDYAWGMVRGRPLRDADGRMEQVLVSFSDITALRLAEEARREALREAERFRRALDQVPAYVYMKDRDSRYTYGNAQVLALFGVTAEELPGAADERFFPPETVALLREIDLRVLAGHDSREELSVNEPDGRVRHYVEVKSPLRDAADPSVTTGVLGITIDLTERKALEEQLQQAQRLEAIGRLAGGIAHDFNNMLGVILGRAELALMSAPPDTSLHEDLREIRSAAERSSELTRHLLAFARRQHLLPRTLELAVEMPPLLRLLRRLIREDIPLRWQPASDVWPVWLDPTQLDQILTNLCVNARDAIRAASADGQVAQDVHAVTITAENAAVDAAFCARHAEASEGEYVVLAVHDTGGGIPDDVRPRIFEPFFTTKPLGEGTGLGLPTVFGTVRQAGGFLLLHSQPDEGTTFAAYLPRSLEPADQRTPAPALGTS
jgi:PAS domain S-box-containing protein